MSISSVSATPAAAPAASAAGTQKPVARPAYRTLDRFDAYARNIEANKGPDKFKIVLNAVQLASTALAAAPASALVNDCRGQVAHALSVAEEHGAYRGSRDLLARAATQARRLLLGLVKKTPAQEQAILALDAALNLVGAKGIKIDC